MFHSEVLDLGALQRWLIGDKHGLGLSEWRLKSRRACTYADRSGC